MKTLITAVYFALCTAAMLVCVATIATLLGWKVTR